VIGRLYKLFIVSFFIQRTRGYAVALLIFYLLYFSTKSLKISLHKTGGFYVRTV
jgi:hypothetical protein